MIKMEVIDMIMLLIIIIIITKQDILVEHGSFSSIPSFEPNNHYFDSQES